MNAIHDVQQGVWLQYPCTATMRFKGLKQTDIYKPNLQNNSCSCNPINLQQNSCGSSKKPIPRTNFLADECGRLLWKPKEGAWGWSTYLKEKWLCNHACGKIHAHPNVKNIPHFYEKTEIPELYCGPPRKVCLCDKELTPEPHQNPELTSIEKALELGLQKLRRTKPIIIWICGHAYEYTHRAREIFGKDLAHALGYVYVNMDEEVQSLIKLEGEESEKSSDITKHQGNDDLSAQALVRLVLMSFRLASTPGSSLNEEGIVEMLKLVMIYNHNAKGFVIDSFPCNEPEALCFEAKFYPMTLAIHITADKSDGKVDGSMYMAAEDQDYDYEEPDPQRHGLTSLVEPIHFRRFNKYSEMDIENLCKKYKERCLVLNHGRSIGRIEVELAEALVLHLLHEAKAFPPEKIKCNNFDCSCADDNPNFEEQQKIMKQIHENLLQTKPSFRMSALISDQDRRKESLHDNDDSVHLTKLGIYPQHHGPHWRHMDIPDSFYGEDGEPLVTDTETEGALTAGTIDLDNITDTDSEEEAKKALDAKNKKNKIEVAPAKNTKRISFKEKVDHKDVPLVFAPEVHKKSKEPQKKTNAQNANTKKKVLNDETGKYVPTTSEESSHPTTATSTSGTSYSITDSEDTGSELKSNLREDELRKKVAAKTQNVKKISLKPKQPAPVINKTYKKLIQLKDEEKPPEKVQPRKNTKNQQNKNADKSTEKIQAIVVPKGKENNLNGTNAKLPETTAKLDNNSKTSEKLTKNKVTKKTPSLDLTKEKNEAPVATKSENFAQNFPIKPFVLKEKQNVTKTPEQTGKKLETNVTDVRTIDLKNTQEVQEISKISEKGKEIPKIPEKAKEIPTIGEKGKEISKISEKGKEIPKIGEKGKEIPKIGEKGKEIPKIGKKGKEIPKIGEKGKEISKIPEKAKEIPIEKPGQKGKEIPKIVEKLQPLPTSKGNTNDKSLQDKKQLTAQKGQENSKNSDKLKKSTSAPALLKPKKVTEH